MNMNKHHITQMIAFVTIISVLVNTRNSLAMPSEGKGASKTIANECPESSPWPCREPGFCLSFDFICDGEQDCPDGYDEDQEMCTAKQRPPIEYLHRFIQKYRDWLIPDVLGEGTPLELAKKLVESPTIDEYAKTVKLTPMQLDNFRNLIDGVAERKEISLVLMGMPLGAWSELYFLFNRIVESGFVGQNESV